MEDDLELRRYIQALMRRSWLILLLALAAGAAGFGYAALRRPAYQASTLLAVSRPLFALNLSGVDQNTQVPVKLYGELALSDQVLQTLVEQLQAAGPAPSLTQLRLRLTAVATTETGLLRLSTVYSTGAEAVHITNLWADIILAQSVALYGPESPQMLTYQAQLETARATLAAADAARAAYQSQNQVSLLGAELDSLRAQLAAAYDRQTRYTLLADDVRSLQARLDGQAASAPASTTDEAALLLLVAEATNAGLPAPLNTTGNVQTETGTSVDIIQQSPAPLQVQIGITSGASSQTVRDLSAAVDTFATDLAARAAAAGSLTAALAPQILQLQTDLAVANTVAQTYGTAVALADGQYIALAGLVSEAHIAAQDAAGLVRIASPAVSATLTSTSQRLTTAAAAAVAGLILAVVLIVALEWWRSPLPKPRAALPDQAP